MLRTILNIIQYTPLSKRVVGRRGFNTNHIRKKLIFSGLNIFSPIEKKKPLNFSLSNRKISSRNIARKPLNFSSVRKNLSSKRRTKKHKENFSGNSLFQDVFRNNSHQNSFFEDNLSSSNATPNLIPGTNFQNSQPNDSSTDLFVTPVFIRKFEGSNKEEGTPVNEENEEKIEGTQEK